MSAPLVTPSRDALAKALRSLLTDNALCVAADERARVYDHTSASDSDLATADRDFCEAVERTVLDALIASGAVIDAATLADDVRRAITEHADHMEGYTLPGLQQGFLNGWDHALRLLRRDAGFIASRLTTALVERGEQHG
jgi:hypothetical protein